MSSPNIQLCPKDTKPEYAFIGRSNVGKSSLINMLCNHKNLAKTSATPGKTLLINHFIINNEWYLVDLPGYGFAKRSKTVQQKLEQMPGNDAGDGIALVNIQKRLQILYGAQGTLSVSRSPLGGLRATLRIEEEVKNVPSSYGG